MNDLFTNKETQKKFLTHYWEKESYFFKEFLDIEKNFIDLADLEEMINDEYFETRFVEKINNQLKLTPPPKSIKEIKTITHPWTLIVHNLNFYNNFCHQLEKAVSFIPHWLFDDVMCTYSSDNSTLEAHIDRYNVLILQVSGKRKWDLQYNPKDEYRDDCDIRVLKEFKTDESFELGPGDMIYIPPGVAHRGTSIGESLSLSIGFQSLEHKDIFEKHCSQALSKIAHSYVTTENELNSSPIVANEAIVQNLYKELLAHIGSIEEFKKCLFSHLSLNKLDSPIENEALDFNSFSEAIKDKGFLFFEDLKLVTDESSSLFYINGKNYPTKKDSFLKLYNDYTNKAEDIYYCSDSSYAKLLFELYQDNLLALEE